MLFVYYDVSHVITYDKISRVSTYIKILHVQYVLNDTTGYNFYKRRKIKKTQKKQKVIGRGGGAGLHVKKEKNNEKVRERESQI